MRYSNRCIRVFISMPSHTGQLDLVDGQQQQHDGQALAQPIMHKLNEKALIYYLPTK